MPREASVSSNTKPSRVQPYRKAKNEVRETTPSAASAIGKNSRSSRSQNKQQQQAPPSTPLWRTEQEQNITAPVYFWKPHESWGFFSQWYACPIKDPETNTTFSCNEQFMMYHKALTFNDAEIAQQILDTDNPKKQRSLGRKVRGFTDEKWNQVRYEIVVEANRLKFNQGTARSDDVFVYPPHGWVQEEGLEEMTLGELLIGTGNRELVEASARDRVWGIGYSQSKARDTPRAKWGRNFLGKALMEVRSQLTQQDAVQDAVQQ
ncbi:hypothetical protein LTS08_001524 [Lithohypha guttulata]|uniref:uncharacterized protein n=1 Tax=Lithohypha guttulata TaxID=1690604 RepID=UPI002DDF1A35|nr:hypothetical protein LTR51_003810 [Lithohypha guttulata]KAK5105249.1 hypothetical protein LTS08_001524 [Lithohypha guttulata]